MNMLQMTAHKVKIGIQYENEIEVKPKSEKKGMTNTEGTSTFLSRLTFTIVRLTVYTPND